MYEHEQGTDLVENKFVQEKNQAVSFQFVCTLQIKAHKIEFFYILCLKYFKTYKLAKVINKLPTCTLVVNNTSMTHMVV